jgi:soluble cytochrome b562
MSNEKFDGNFANSGMPVSPDVRIAMLESDLKDLEKRTQDVFTRIGTTLEGVRQGFLDMQRAVNTQATIVHFLKHIAKEKMGVTAEEFVEWKQGFDKQVQELDAHAAAAIAQAEAEAAAPKAEESRLIVE